MTSSAFMYSTEDSTAKKADSMPNILLRIDYEWPLIFLWDIWAIKIQERLSPSSRVTNFRRARVIRSLHYPWGGETTCNLVGEGCVTSKKKVSVCRRQYCFVQAKLLRFLSYFAKIAHMSVVWEYVSSWLRGFVCSDVCCRANKVVGTMIWCVGTNAILASNR